MREKSGKSDKSNYIVEMTGMRENMGTKNYMG